MKKHFFTLSFFVLFVMPFVALAHTATATNTIGTHPSAVLEIRSNSQGFLPPRLTTQQRNAISAPATGMLIYNTRLQSLEIHVGNNNWLKVGASSSGLIEFFDADKDTGIHLDIDGNDDDTIRFFNDNNEHISINASGTLHIKGVLKDAAGNVGTAGQLLSSTVTGTQWMDNEVTIFDADVNTGIHVDKNGSNDGILHFDINGQEYMSINASGTLHIKGALKDAADNDGTAGQLLSSTGTSTRWVNPTIQFEDNSAFSALTSSTVSPGAMVVNTTSRTLHVRNQANDDWTVYEPAKIYHTGPQDTVEREYRTVVSRATGQVWLDRNIGASQRATSPTDAAAYGHYFRWTEINASGPYAGSGVGKICPTGFRLPNVAEWLAEFPSIIASNDCAQNAFNHLFLPLAGYRSKGMAGDVTTGGSSQSEVRSYLWSSSTLTSDAAQRLFFSADGAGIGNDKKSYSYSVRCLKE